MLKCYRIFLLLWTSNVCDFHHKNRESCSKTVQAIHIILLKVSNVRFYNIFPSVLVIFQRSSDTFMVYQYVLRFLPIWTPWSVILGSVPILVVAWLTALGLSIVYPISRQSELLSCTSEVGSSVLKLKQGGIRHSEGCVLFLEGHNLKFFLPWPCWRFSTHEVPYKSLEMSVTSHLV